MKHVDSLLNSGWCPFRRIVRVTNVFASCLHRLVCRDSTNVIRTLPFWTETFWFVDKISFTNVLPSPVALRNLSQMWLSADTWKFHEVPPRLTLHTRFCFLSFFCFFSLSFVVLGVQIRSFIMRFLYHKFLAARAGHTTRNVMPLITFLIQGTNCTLYLIEVDKTNIWIISWTITWHWSWQCFQLQITLADRTDPDNLVRT